MVRNKSPVTTNYLLMSENTFIVLKTGRKDPDVVCDLTKFVILKQDFQGGLPQSSHDTGDFKTDCGKERRGTVGSQRRWDPHGSQHLSGEDRDGAVVSDRRHTDRDTVKRTSRDSSCV